MSKSSTPSKSAPLASAVIPGLAASIAASWTDPEVRAARTSRLGVRVGRTEYRSMTFALADHAPHLASRLIALRMALREQGAIEIEGIRFVAVPKG